MSRLLWLIAPILACSAANAFTFRKPTAPNYWSGTNCRGTGSGTRLSRGEIGLHDYKIEINDTQVFTMPRNGTFQEGAHGGVVFDSSHFLNGETVTVKTFAKPILEDGSIGPWQNDGGYSAVVKNTALAIISGAGDFDDAAVQEVVDDQKRDLEQVNPDHPELVRWATTKRNGTTPWTLSEFLTKSVGKGVALVSTHGADVGIGLYDSNLTPGIEVTAANLTLLPGPIQSARMSNNGAGLYPYNSSGNPPHWVVFLMACSQGPYIPTQWTDAFLYPFQSAYQEPMYRNQCVIGLNEDIFIASLKNLWKRFYDRILQGENVGNALYLEFLYPDYDPTREVSVVDESGERLATFDDFAFGGDPFARIHGVYTGSDLKVVGQWWL